MASIEIETVEELKEHLAKAGAMTNVVVQGLDLSGMTAELDAVDLSGAVFLGTVLAQSTYERAFAAGAVVFRPPLETPFSPYRSRLYTPKELFGEFDPGNPSTYAATLDERVYQYTRQPNVRSDILHSLACRLHDHAITDALEEKIAGRRVVAIMGGHSLGRTAVGYRTVALIAKQLAETGLLVATGGGPGAMEAAHFGVWMANRGARELDAALAILGESPQFVRRESWLATALAVKTAYPQLSGPDGSPAASFGIPTWHYGHEPPTVFATDIAKYFANSVREEGLLAIAKAGVVFSPGSAGTIQEVFQDAAQNHYRSYGHPSPMVFLGMDYWTNVKPVYPLLTDLATGHPYAELIRITDDPAEVVEYLRNFSPGG